MRLRVIGSAMVVVLIIQAQASSALAAKPEGQAGAKGAEKSLEQRQQHEEARELRLETCVNKADKDCYGIQKGLHERDVDPGWHGEATGRGHEKGMEPGKAQGKGYKGKP